VVRIDQSATTRQHVLGAVGKTERGKPASLCTQHRSVRNRTEREHHGASGQAVQLGPQEIIAVGDLGGRGLLAGGTHFTAFVMRAPCSTRPSCRDADTGALAQPNRCKVSYSSTPA